MAIFRGHSLSVAQIALIVAPSFILFGYNQAGVGGLLSVCLPLLVISIIRNTDFKTASRLDKNVPANRHHEH